jgi:phage terminase small subunit
MLNERRKRFAREVVKGKTGTQAALDAGYCNTRGAAAVQAHRLLNNDKTVAEIHRVRERVEKKAIADAQERQELLTSILRAHGAEETKDVIKAVETLGKMQGDFIARTEDVGDLRARLQDLRAKMSPAAYRELLLALSQDGTPPEAVEEPETAKEH